MDQVQHLIAEMKTMWRAGQIDSVARVADQILQSLPDNTVAHDFRLRAALQKENWPVVAASAAGLVQAEPQRAFNAARKLARSGDLAEAARIFLRLRTGPGPSDLDDLQDAAENQGAVLLRAGTTATAAGETELAKLYWRAGLHIAPHNHILRDKVRGLRIAALRHAQAIDAATDPRGYRDAWVEVCQFDPDNAGPLRKLAVVADHSDESVEAVHWWSEVLRLAPSDSTAASRLVRAALRARREDQAIEALMASGAGGANTSHIELLREGRRDRIDRAQQSALKTARRAAVETARTASLDDNPVAYMDAWKAVLGLEPQNAVAARKLASAAEKIGQPAEAVEWWGRLLDIEPTNETAPLRLARAARIVGLEDVALRVLVRNGVADAEQPHVYKLRAGVLKECRRALKASEAVSAFEHLRLLEASAPSEGAGLETLSHAVLRSLVLAAKDARLRKAAALAGELAERILVLDPSHKLALLILTRRFLASKDYAHAVEYSRRLLDEDPDYPNARTLHDRAVESLGSRMSSGAVPT